MDSIRREIRKVGQELGWLSKESARVTQERLYLNYKNLGDFGGSNPITDSWVLEVSGPTFGIKDELKRLGLQFDPRSKTWKRDAVKYKYLTRQNGQDYERDRKIQEAAYPVLKKLVQEYNDKVDAANKALGPSDPRAFTEMMLRHERMLPKLEAAGLKVTFDHPNRWESRDSKVIVSGNTYPLIALMKKHGFKWDPSRKVWGMPSTEYRVVGDAWMGEIIRQLPKAPPSVEDAVFSRMSDAELTKFLQPVVEKDWDLNEGYDGEVSMAELMAQHKLRVKRKTPAEQHKFYQEVQQGRWT